MPANGKTETYLSDVVVDNSGDREHDANGMNGNHATNGTGHANGNGAHRANGEANGANGNGTTGANVEWHRNLIDEYKKIEGGVGEHAGNLGQGIKGQLDELGQGVNTQVDAVGKTVEDLGKNVEHTWQDAMKFLWQEKDDNKDAGQKKAQEAVRKKLGLEPGPDIKLKCIDGMDGKLKAAEVDVKWEDSFEDVLRKLKQEFKRDVIFEYEVNGRVIRVHDDQSFDRAIHLAEGSNNILYCVIQQAAWREAPIEEPEPDEPEPPEEDLIITCYDRMAYNPAPYKPLLLFGLIGFTISLITSIIGYTSMGDSGTYLASVSITIPLPYFIHTFTVKKTQSKEATFVKTIVAVSGACMGIVALVAYYQLPAIDGIFAAALWSLSTTFYLWATYPLFSEYWQQFLVWKTKTFAGLKNRRQQKGKVGGGEKKKKGKAEVAARVTKILQAVKNFIIEWLWLIIYMLVLGTLQYTPLQHTTNLVALKSKYEPLGLMVDRGDGKQNHIVCRGNPNDGRPVVIMEAMEGLGQALAMVKVQERLQTVGIVCAYDRAGFGWSPRSSAARTPQNIAEELGAMLDAIETEGVEIEVTPAADGSRREGVTTTQIKAGTYGYVLVGHSIGSVYVRMFAYLFPKKTAALVLWDALLTEDTTLGVKFRTPQNDVLSPFLLDICTMYLEPMGFIDLFMRSVVLTPIINGSVFNQPKPEGLGGDYDRMISRMLRREWCPSVKAEVRDLYTGGKPGIFTVVDADIARYEKPMVVWARGQSVYTGAIERDQNYTIEGIPACDPSHTAIVDDATNHPEGTMGWACVQFKALHYSTNPYLNPHKRTCEIIGQPQLGKENPCPDIFRSENGTELAPLQSAGVVAELANTILDAWAMVGDGFTTQVPSDPIAYTFQGFPPGCTHYWCPLPPEEWTAAFQADVEKVLGARFQGTVSVKVIQGPAPCPLVGILKPAVLGQLAVGDCPPRLCTDANTCASPWQLGPLPNEPPPPPAAEGGEGNGTAPAVVRRALWGSQEEEARAQNALGYEGYEGGGGGRRAFSEESYFAVFQLVGYKMTAVVAAEEVLSCAERGANPCNKLPLSAEAQGSSNQTEQLRTKETDRRNTLFETYNLSSITVARRDSSNNSFTFVIENPRDVVVLCPPNTYKWGVGCRQCPLNATAKANSPDKTKCHCDANFYLEVVDEEWTCTRCPPNSQSNCGSTLPTDCKCNPGYTGADGLICRKCPLNTYKSLRGHYNCTSCSASASGCDVTRDNLEDCHASVLTADAALGTVMHPRWGNISMGAKWGTNCTIAVPTIADCVNGSAVLGEADGPSYAEARGDFDEQYCQAPPIVTQPIQMEDQANAAVIMQRCVRFGLFGCEVYGNVSLQTWPVYSDCNLCDPDNELKGVCCVAAHLNRPCNPDRFPGGSPGHCREVPALTLLAQGNEPKVCDKD